MSEQDGRFSTVIRKDLRKLFWRDSKGELVNELLTKHYMIKTSVRHLKKAKKLQTSEKKKT